jgi:hypothetical protein
MQHAPHMAEDFDQVLNVKVWIGFKAKTAAPGAAELAEIGLPRIATPIDTASVGTLLCSAPIRVARIGIGSGLPLV